MEQSSTGETSDTLKTQIPRNFFTYKNGKIRKSISHSNSVIFYQTDQFQKKTQEYYSGDRKESYDESTASCENYTSSYSGQSSIEDLPFLSMTGINTSDPPFKQHHSKKTLTTPLNETIVASFKNSHIAPLSTTDMLGHIPDLLASPLQSDTTESRSIAIQSDTPARESRRTFDRKVRSVCPNAKPSSNVFILLTSGTGQCLFAASTRTNQKNRNISRQQNYDLFPSENLTEAEHFIDSNSAIKIRNIQQKEYLVEMNKKLSSHKETIKNVESDNLISDIELSKSMFMINVSTQTMHTLPRKHKDDPKLSTNGNSVPSNSNFLKNIERKPSSQQTSNVKPHTDNEYAVPSSSFEKSTVVPVPVKTPPKTNTVNPFNYSHNSSNADRNGNENAGEVNNTNSTEGKTRNNNQPLPPNIHIKIDGVKESYNVSIQYSHSKHESLTINTKISKITRTDTEQDITSSDVLSEKQNGLRSNYSSQPISRRTESDYLPKRIITNFNVFTKRAGNFDVTKKEEVISKAGSVQHKMHYRGDACRLKDPVERDLEIQRLLGIERRYTPSASKSQPSWSSAHYGTKNSRNRIPRKNSSSSSDRLCSILPEKKIENKLFKSKTLQCQLCCSMRPEQNKSVIEHSPIETPYVTGTREGEPNLIGKTDIKEIKSDSCNHKPINLSQSEYSLIKRSIHENALLSRTHHRLIKKNVNFRNLLNHPTTINCMEASYNICLTSNPHLRKSSKLCCKSCNIEVKTGLYQLSVATQTSTAMRKSSPCDFCSSCQFDHMRRNFVICNTQCSVLTILANRDRARSLMEHTPLKCGRRNAMSTVAFHTFKRNFFRPVSSVSEMKKVWSAVNADDIMTPWAENKMNPSVYTLFKGNKKASRFSPNFGTSTFTLCSKDDRQMLNDENIPKPYQETIEKKQSFLKKLARILGRKKTKTEKGQREKIWIPSQREQTLDSSLDSYHINSSFEEIDMTSSIYDTSASHYSRHTIAPVGSITGKSNKSFLKKIKSYF